MTRYHNEAICDRCGDECNGSPGGHVCEDLVAAEKHVRDKYGIVGPVTMDGPGVTDFLAGFAAGRRMQGWP